MKWDAVKDALTKAIKWVRNVDTNEQIMAALDKINDKIDGNEKARLRSEIVRYYNKMLANQPISTQEYSYLMEEVFAPYTALGGNGLAKHMMEQIEKYVLNGGN